MRADSEVRPPERLPPKVLVVDDEPDLLESTALLIESLGYEAVRLDDATHVLEVVERERPGLILQDLRMEDLNLSGLVAALRSNPATAEIPLVFYSASEDIATTAARYDVWGYLSKPFARGEMASLLERLFATPPEREAGLDLRNLKRELRGLFHDQWDLISALNNYIQVLEGRKDLDDEETRCVHGLDQTLLKLESKTDRLRSYVLSLVDAMEPVEEGDEPPEQ